MAHKCVYFSAKTLNEQLLWILGYNESVSALRMIKRIKGIEPPPRGPLCVIFAGNVRPRVFCRHASPTNQRLRSSHSEASPELGVHKMAARWGAGEETLTACNMDLFQLDKLDGVK